MKRYLRLFLIIFLMIMSINIVKAENYKTGELISYNNIKFYVMEDNGDYLTLLKATPLTVDEVNNYGKGYVNKNTSVSQGTAYDVKGYGYGSVIYNSIDNCTSGYYNCKTDYNDSDIKHIVDGWSNSVLNQSDLKEVNVSDNNYRVRLITKNELVNNFYYSNNIPSIKTPKWIYNFSYWIIDDSPKFIESRSLAGSSSIYYGEINGADTHFNRPYYFAQNISGDYDTVGVYVRPVIHLNKSASINKIKNNLKDINDTEFKIGDIIEYNGKEFYVLKDASKTDDKLTMVTKLPLSYEEVNKIDIGNNTLINGTIGLEDNTEYHPGYVRYYYNSDNCREYHNEGCSTDYKQSHIKPIVDEWAGSFFENNDLTEDELGYKARLITIEELNKNLKYVGRGPAETNQITSTEYYEMSEDTPFALYDCFTMSQILDSNYQVYSIDENGNVGESKVYDTKGICPVVTIEKKVATNSDNNNINKDNKISIPDTLLKNPVFIVVIGIILIVIATITVSLILKRKK